MSDPLRRALAEAIERAAEGGARKADGGIIAYHGSPHDFDRFDLSKIGTGEGVQQYGKGAYLAEHPDTARYYRDSLTDDHDIRVNDTLINDLYSSIEQRAANMPIKRAEAEYSKLAVLEDLANGGDVLHIAQQMRNGAYDPHTFEWFLKEIAPKFRRNGVLYEARINADPDSFIDFDAPLREQPKLVQSVLQIDPREISRLKPKGADAITLRKALDLNDGAWSDLDLIINNDRELYERARDSARRAGQDIGGDFDPGEWLANKYRGYVTLMQPSDDVSRLYRGRETELAEKGIPGVKYLDQLSRDSNQGTRNYVVFKDGLIDILKKYGIAGLTAGGGAAGLRQALDDEMGERA